MKFAVVRFPGSNCDADCLRALTDGAGEAAEYVWHEDPLPDEVEAVVLPGGFSYGDYLRCGAIARFSPVMQEVRRAAERGMPVLGICNGMQILTEAGLLPGAMLPNEGGHFLCQDVELRVEQTDTPFSASYRTGQVVRMPIAHGEGRWHADAETLQRVQANRQIVFRYCKTPNGSMDDVAGLCNEARNVVGLMPHPERACDLLLGGQDGLGMFHLKPLGLQSEMGELTDSVTLAPDGIRQFKKAVAR
ncbi:MAG: phosphoribosylformylglycinamidine synthase subunit PurQ [Candidatus Xenobia bacterium]